MLMRCQCASSCCDCHIRHVAAGSGQIVSSAYDTCTSSVFAKVFARVCLRNCLPLHALLLLLPSTSTAAGGTNCVCDCARVRHFCLHSRYHGILQTSCYTVRNERVTARCTMARVWVSLQRLISSHPCMHRDRSRRVRRRCYHRVDFNSEMHKMSKSLCAEAGPGGVPGMPILNSDTQHPWMGLNR